MLIYIFIFLSLSIISFIEIFSNKYQMKIKKTIVTIISLFFLVLSTIRWQRGTDWNPYFNFFSNIQNIPLENNNLFEVGYKYLNYFVSLISKEYTFFLFICALIVFIFQRKAIINLSSITASKDDGVTYPLTMLFIMWSLYLGNIFTVRSTLAYIILLHSIIYIRDKKKVQFIIFVIIATLFHRSSIIFFLAYFIYHFRLTKITIISCIITIPLILHFSSDILILLSKILGGSYEYKVFNYIYNDRQGSEYAGLINTVFLLFVFLFIYWRNDRSDSHFLGMFNLFFFGAILYFGTYLNSVSLTRMALPFMMCQIYLIPYIFNVVKNNKIKIIVFLVFFVYLAMRYYSVLSVYWDLYIPFKTIFNLNLDVNVY
ncbi:EpsG family protein [Paenibacillus sp. NPDC058177]|uniref:EpsG family protein n=1 Tax=Paenibacillus sp. NPDC058177 TaxID=3346369 RepID=UPI0036DDC417